MYKYLLDCIFVIYLGRSRHEARFSHHDFLVACENPGNTISFGDEGSIDHGEGQSRHDASHSTRNERWSGQKGQRGTVGHHHTHKDDVG